MGPVEFGLDSHLVVETDKNDGQISKESAVKSFLMLSSTICQLGTTKGIVCPFVHSNSVFALILGITPLNSYWYYTVLYITM